MDKCQWCEEPAKYGSLCGRHYDEYLEARDEQKRERDETYSMVGKNFVFLVDHCFGDYCIRIIVGNVGGSRNMEKSFQEVTTLLDGI